MLLGCLFVAIVVFRNASEFINLFSLMVCAGIPELTSREDIQYLRSMLKLEMTEEQVRKQTLYAACFIPFHLLMV